MRHTSIAGDRQALISTLGVLTFYQSRPRSHADRLHAFSEGITGCARQQAWCLAKGEYRRVAHICSDRGCHPTNRSYFCAFYSPLQPIGSAATVMWLLPCSGLVKRPEHVTVNGRLKKSLAKSQRCALIRSFRCNKQLTQRAQIGL